MDDLERTASASNFIGTFVQTPHHVGQERALQNASSSVIAAIAGTAAIAIAGSATLENATAHFVGTRALPQAAPVTAEMLQRLEGFGNLIGILQGPPTAEWYWHKLEWAWVHMPSVDIQPLVDSALKVIDAMK